MEWKPIETAPKDGTAVLLYFSNSPHQIWIGAWVRHSDPSYPFVWRDPTGSILVREWKDDVPPTHWMPLPEPPHA
jgi:hypothetical protein